MQAAAERVGVAQVAGDDVHAQLVHLLLLMHLGGLHDDGLRVEDQAVHGQPHGGVAQRRRLGVRGLGGLDDLPVVGLEDGALRLGQRAVRVVDDQARAQRHEGRVDVDRVGVAGEVHGVHAVLGVVALEPVHGGAVGGQAVLDEQVLAHAHHVGGVPHRLDLGGHEVLVGGAHQALLKGDLLVVVVVLVGAVGQAGTGGLGPLEVGILLEVLLHEGPVGQVLEVAAAEGVGGGHDLVADGQQDVARRHAGHHGVVAEVRRADGLVPLQRGRAVDDDAAVLEDLHEVLEALVAASHGVGGTQAPHAAHLGVNRHLLRGGGLLRRDDGVVAAADDDALQRIPVVPRADDLCHNMCSYLIGTLPSLLRLAAL